MAPISDVPSWVAGYEFALHAATATRGALNATLIAPAISAVSALVAVLSLANATALRKNLRIIVSIGVPTGNTQSSEPVVRVVYPDPQRATEVIIVVVNEGTQSETIQSIVISVSGDKGFASVSPYPHVILPGKSLTYIIPVHDSSFRLVANARAVNEVKATCQVTFYDLRGALQTKEFDLLVARLPFSK